MVKIVVKKPFKVCCEKCDYVWNDFHSGNGRVAFLFRRRLRGVLLYDRSKMVVCSLCAKGVEDYIPSDTDDDDSDDTDDEGPDYSPVLSD